MFELLFAQHMLRMMAAEGNDQFGTFEEPQLEPPWVIRQRHRRFIEQRSTEALSNHRQLIRTSVSNPVSPSSTPFNQLKRTWIHHLPVEQAATGSYVLARVIEKGYTIVGWSTVIEDDHGTVCDFALYNYPPNELFPVGTVIIIKEPYFKMVVSGSLFIRCDCPTDIVPLRSPSHPLFSSLSQCVEWEHEPFEPEPDPLMAEPKPTTAKEWKERGNSLFDKKLLVLAREAYNLGLGVGEGPEDPNLKLLKLNLIAVHFELGYYEKALEVAEEMLKEHPLEKKALFRLGKAYYALRKYTEALKTFKRFVELFPEVGEGQEELKRAKDRVAEQKGKVDVHKLRQRAIKSPSKEIDHADFKGPVSIVKIEGKGRGVVLTKDVKKGDVLMVSKALAATLNPLNTIGTQLNPGRSVDFDLDTAEMVTQLSQLLYKNSHTFGPQLYDLYAGSRDSARLFCDAETESEPICDVERLREICDSNAFEVKFAKPELSTRKQGEALVLLPSYLNHSCAPNAVYNFFNNVMVVLAAKDLKAGTELTISYVPLQLNFEERSHLIRRRGLQCHCTKCKRRI